jgi:hypothetical protein
VIAEIFPEHYDVHGRRIPSPGTRARRLGFHRLAPMGSYLTQPLQTHCKDLEEIRQLLCKCRARRRRNMQRRDVWQLPEQFEKSKMGNCVDFGLWTWHQLVDLGFAARFVVGKAGKFGAGHAWVTFERDGKHFLLEPQLRVVGLRMPRISSLRYHPKVSVAWDGKRILYYEHEDRSTEPPLRSVPGLVAEWLAIWIPFWVRVSYRIPIGLLRRLAARIRGRAGTGQAQPCVSKNDQGSGGSK